MPGKNQKKIARLDRLIISKLHNILMNHFDTIQYFRRVMDTSVKMAGDDRLRIETAIKNRSRDLVVQALITLPGDTILDAWGELRKGILPERYQLPIQNLAKLTGLKIGPGFIRQVKNILGDVEDLDFILDAVVEIARGYKQLNDVSGVLPPPDLDFADARKVRDFEIAIRPEFFNTCIVFKEGIEDTFASKGVLVNIRHDIYGPQPVQVNRFRRDKVQEAYILDDRVQLREHLMDDGHEMVVEILVDRKTREIQDIAGKAYRVPYVNLCDRPFMKTKELVGSHLDQGFEERVFKSVGGSTGCAHLVDIILEMVRYLDSVVRA